MSAPPLLVATRSRHKLAEIRDILTDLPIAVIGPDDLGLAVREEEDELEPFDTFARNALSKARYFHGRSGLPTLADDSGLCVDALHGGPGVRTRRFAPEDWAERWGRDEANNRWLLERLAEVPAEARGARYRCCVAVTDEMSHATFDGAVEGTIAEAPQGEGGFGYDPLFLLGDGDRTYAELPERVKRETSHRAAAVRAARAWIEAHVVRR